MIDPELFEENRRTAPTLDERKFAAIGSLDLESGASLSEVTIAYETWGELSPNADNAILICHALSGDSHAVGWWDRLVGPGKPIDTERCFVIGTNALGGCQGSTGPATEHEDGRPYGSRFPRISVGDMVSAQQRLIAQLGIQNLLGVAGGSMGGMMAIEWARRNTVRKAFVTASARAHNAMQIGFNEAARQAVVRDPNWNAGDYYGGLPPSAGLAVARMVGHLSFLSEEAFEAKFGRRKQSGPPGRLDLGYRPEDEIFQIESYLNYQGEKFADRFDANSLIVLTRAIDEYELTSFEGSTAEFLFVSFTSDWIYPPHQSQELHQLALAAGCRSEWHNLELAMGHDAFLLDGTHQGRLVSRFFGE